MRTTILLIASLFFVDGSALAAGDATKGKSRSSICAACHGPTGVATKHELWPNLAGQKADYIANQLKAYQSGARKDAAMEAVAKLLTVAEITDLAAYFAQQAPSQPQVLKKQVMDEGTEERRRDPE